MFSFDYGTPIAKFTNGKYKDKLILKVADTIENKNSNKILGNDIEFKSKIIPIHNNKSRIHYICGSSGCGKSTMASKILESYKKENPKNEIYIFSRKSNDIALDHLKPIWVSIDDELLENPIDITKEVEKGGCCFLFDDYNTIQDKELRECVSNLMHDIMEVGRAYNICCVITNHLINGDNKKDMRTIFNEAHTITIFPKGGNIYGIRYMLKNYIGYDKSVIERILKLNSRWCTIYKHYPNYVLYENGAFIP